MSIIHWVGIDDHADNWTIVQYRGSEQTPAKGWTLVPSEAAYRKLIGWLKSLEGEAKIVYEAGPCGYEMYRRLSKAGLNCRVAAPSLTPKKPGDRVKTNRRDADKLARYLRTGDLTLIAVPDPEREALRDLVRGREAVQREVVRLRNQIGKLLLRYGYRYREGATWTQRHWTWLRQIKFEDNYRKFLFHELLLTLESRVEQVCRYDDEIEAAAKQVEYAPYVAALSVLRGVSTLAAMIILSELGDLRRFTSARQLMAAVGLVPSESSTGDKINRLSITKTGNAHVRRIVVEAAWQYQRRVTTGPKLYRRRKDQPPHIVDVAHRCDLRLNRKVHRMTSRGKRSTVAAVAVARELLGFIWAIGQAVHP